MQLKHILSTLALCASATMQAQQHIPFLAKIQHQPAQRIHSLGTFLPLTEKQYVWNSGSSAWDSVSIRNYHYTESVLDTVNIGDPTDNTYVSREIYSQTATEQVMLKQLRNGSVWENAEKSVETFDAQGFATGNQFYLWVNGDWTLQFGERYLTTYDGSGNLVAVEMQYYDNAIPDWVTYQNELALYDQGKLTQLIFQEPSADGTLEDIVKVELIYAPGAAQADTANTYMIVGGQWMLNGRYIVERWINYTDIVNLEPVTFVEQEFSMGVFSNVSRQTRSDFDNNGYSDLLEYFDGNEWYPSSRYTLLIDDRGNIVQEKSESISPDQVTIDYASLFTYFYDANDNILERIEQGYDTGSNAFVNLNRSVFGDYLDVTGLEKPLSGTFIVYPNPTASLLFLEANRKFKQLRIVSVQGAVVWEGSASSSAIDVSTLDSGVYILEGISENERVHSRFVKQ